MSLRKGKGAPLFPAFTDPEGKAAHSHLGFSILPTPLVLGLA